MPRRGGKGGERGRRKAECLIFESLYPASEPAESIFFCFLVWFVLWSMRDGLERKDTGSADAGYAVQGLSSKCKNYHFSNGHFALTQQAWLGCAVTFSLFPLKSGQCLHLCVAHRIQAHCIWSTLRYRAPPGYAAAAAANKLEWALEEMSGRSYEYFAKL